MSTPPGPACDRDRARADAYRVLFDGQFRPILGYALRRTACAADAADVAAEANERILVDSDGWKVSRVDEFTVSDGEMTFSDGTHTIDLHWAPAAGYNDRRSKHEQEFGPGSSVKVLGESARMFPYGGGEYETLLAPDGGTFVRIRGNVGGEAAYRALLADLKTVDVKTWLSAMPASAIQPNQQSDTVATMLKGLPLPAGFDRASIDAGEGIRDRYQLGAAVAGAVACGWVSSWAQATENNDAAGVETAIAAMRTAGNWQVLKDMDAEGAYPEAVREIAPAMAGEDTGNVFAAKGTDRLAAMQSLLGCKR